MKEVTYGRLFTIGQYNNERIEFRAETEQGEDAAKILANLFTKVADAEAFLSLYRAALEQKSMAYSEVASCKDRIGRQSKEIASQKVSIAQLTEQLAKGTVDDRLRHACAGQSLKQLEEQLISYEEDLKKRQQELDKISVATDKIRQRLKQGVFSTEGLDFPKNIRRLATFSDMEEE